MKARVIAFYLPQFHPVKENDEIWGKGFTEWTNVANAKPLFRGHYQPQIPADLGFYDLRMPEIREEQAEMAKECGIEGFCYWHYWFGNGRRILERPFEEVLKSGTPNFPFCLGWANHSWSNKTWQKSKGLAKDIVFIKQEYPGEQDYIQHFYTVLPAFKDKRYICVDGKPLFLVFDPEAIPDTELFINTWNRLAKENNLKGIYFVARVPGFRAKDILNNDSNTVTNNFNYFLNVGYNGINADMQRYAETKVAGKFFKISSFVRKKLFGSSLKKYDYKKIMKAMIVPEIQREDVFPQIIPRLDRTPRSGKDARIYANNNPALFKDSIKEVLDNIKEKPFEKRIVFLQAWNEWGEGNYMEPDLKYGKKFLTALKEELDG